MSLKLLKLKYDLNQLNPKVNDVGDTECQKYNLILVVRKYIFLIIRLGQIFYGE